MSDPYRLRMAMIGGGPGSFIGPVHRMAAELDGTIRLVAGAFSQDPVKSTEAGRRYGLDPSRVYPDYHALLAAERTRSDSVDFVAIVAPNHLHYPVACAALRAGFPVISDKPPTLNLSEALSLQRLVRQTGVLYGLTFTYTGFPLVREARDICCRGDLGKIRKVVVEYSQGWLSEEVEKTGSKQAEWRTDPARSGPGGCVSDIGVHAFNIVEFVTGHRVARVCGALSTLGKGRRLDDDCNVLLSLDNGAPGVLHASQIAAGERNGLRLRVYGEHGGLSWSQEDPNQLTLQWLHRPSQTLHSGTNADYLSPRTRGMSRLPLGHDEGYVEAFANLYRDFAAALRPSDESVPSPGIASINEGMRSMAFIERVIESSGSNSAWLSLP